jgi:hypothetical protein
MTLRDLTRLPPNSQLSKKQRGKNKHVDFLTAFWFSAHLKMANS